jgi:hypothetical protein
MTTRIGGALARGDSKETERHTGMGRVNGQEVKVLRDTGATCCIVNARWVRPEQYTGGKEPCVMVDGSVKYYPTALIRVQTEFFRGVTKALVMEKPISDVIIGNVAEASIRPRRTPVIRKQKGGLVSDGRQAELSSRPIVKPHWPPISAGWSRHKSLARGRRYTERGEGQAYRSPMPRELTVDTADVIGNGRHVSRSNSVNDQGSVRQRHGRRSEIGRVAHFVPHGSGTHMMETERSDGGESDERQKRGEMWKEKRVRERRRKERARRRREEERRRDNGGGSGRV